jgi:hypothetical protein
LVPQNPDPSPSQDNPENPHEHENDLPEGEKPQDPQGDTNSEGDKPKESSEEGTVSCFSYHNAPKFISLQ